jgi:hypothetical protein
VPSRARLRRSIASLTACCALAVASDSVPALETDQYYAWGHEMADSTAAVNAKTNDEIRSALEEVNRRGDAARMTCHQVLRRIVPRFRQLIYHEIEVWALHSPLVDRIPADADAESDFRKRYLYHAHGPFDWGTLIPPSPTIEINGVRVGTDKLAHFFSEGWWYYRDYRRARRAGRSPAEAEAKALRRGVLPERTVLGLMASGVFSVADLEANYQGMRFYGELCDAEDPQLAREAGEWRLRRPVDFANYVTPEWDESYQPSIFGKRRWRRVRPILLEYCERLRDPEVVSRRERYRRRDQVTPTEAFLGRLVAAGRLPDPAQFAIEANCLDAAREPR